MSNITLKKGVIQKLFSTKIVNAKCFPKYTNTLKRKFRAFFSKDLTNFELLKRKLHNRIETNNYAPRFSYDWFSIFIRLHDEDNMFHITF